jgi:hypothetical protein
LKGGSFPNALATEHVERVVDAQDGDIFNDGLRRQHMIERIAVIATQHARRNAGRRLVSVTRKTGVPSVKAPGPSKPETSIATTVLISQIVIMVLDQDEHVIRSENGWMRDLLPIYSVPQLAPNFVGLCLVACFSQSIGYFPLGLLPVIMLAWVAQFVSRPTVMTVSTAQAAWLEGLLDDQGVYTWSDIDGRWRVRDSSLFPSLPHLSIEFVPVGGAVTITAPREIMESLRNAVDLLLEHEVFFRGAISRLTFSRPSPNRCRGTPNYRHGCWAPYSPSPFFCT